MNVLIMTAGLPGTGKTYLTKKIMRVLPDYHHLDHTGIRRELGFKGVDPTGKKDRIVLNKVHERASEYLKKGEGVIIDSVHRHKSLRKERYKIAGNEKKQAVIIECICTKKLSIERIKSRESNVAGLVNDTNEEKVYDRLAEEWEPIEEDFKEGFNHVSYLRINTETNKLEEIKPNQEAEKVIDLIKEMLRKKMKIKIS